MTETECPCFIYSSQAMMIQDSQKTVQVTFAHLINVHAAKQTTKSFAIACRRDSEGLYFLDALTGLLTCDLTWLTSFCDT